jgi:hypothetical protein
MKLLNTPTDTLKQYFKEHFLPGYQYFLSFDSLSDWAEKEFISVTQLKQVYPIKDWAKYYIHEYYKKNKQLPKVKDIPKVVLQAYESNSYKLFRASGFRDPKPEMYGTIDGLIKAYNVLPFREADVYGVTVSSFTRYPSGVFVDIPFTSGLIAHYFNPKTMEYVFFTHPKYDPLYSEKEKIQEVYEGIFNITLIIVER